MPSIATTTAKETTFTLHDHPYIYFHLRLFRLASAAAAATSQSRNRPKTGKSTTLFDEITLRQYLTSALTQSFGVTGSAVAVDILKAEAKDAWLRVQSQDADLLAAALAQWSSAADGVSLTVVGRAYWLGGLQRSGATNLWSLER